MSGACEGPLSALAAPSNDQSFMVSPSPQWGWGGQTPALREGYPQHKRAHLLNPTEGFGEKNDFERVQVFAVEGTCRECSSCVLAGPCGQPSADHTFSLLPSGEWALGQAGDQGGQGTGQREQGLESGEIEGSTSYPRPFADIHAVDSALPAGGWAGALASQDREGGPSRPSPGGCSTVCWLLGPGTH